jgi:hypothetical protein
MAGGHIAALKAHLRSNVVGYIAIFCSLSLGSAWAATELARNSVKSKHISRAAVKRSDVARNAINSPRVANGSLKAVDFAPGQLPAGATGPAGPTGPAGSPDTPTQVRDKLTQVDGPGSGVDADTLDGVDGGGYVREIFEGTKSYDPPALAEGECSFTSMTSPTPLLTTDNLVVTPNNGNRYGVQVTGDIIGNSVYAYICNNGQFGTEDLTAKTFNFRVLR